MGARLAVRTAGRFPGTVAAVGGFHGGGLATEEPSSPHLSIPESTAEYAFGHADQDRSMPLEAVERLEETLRGTGRPYLNEVYARAAHGYTMADTSTYDAAAAERHFNVLRGLLDRTL
jgi:carboxymethylenebutenolidase